MKLGHVVVAVAMSVALAACSSSPPKAKPRHPLPLRGAVSQAAVQANNLGIQAYEGKQYEDARVDFEQAVAAARDAAEAHYNLGLALFALGQGDAARDHFIEAANLAPGDKVIWDSPALRPFGSPDQNIQKKPSADSTYSNQRPTFGGGPRR